MSTRRNWDSHPLSRQQVFPSPRPQPKKGGGRTRGGGGVPIPTTGEKLSTLPTLCLNWFFLFLVAAKVSESSPAPDLQTCNI
jgi:hypothetical protein